MRLSSTTLERQADQRRPLNRNQTRNRPAFALVIGWRLREALVSLSDFRLRTHPEFGPADATRCHSLPLAGQAKFGGDLHEWLFLLVNRLREFGPGLSL
jgi:hypothetical protein